MNGKLPAADVGMLLKRAAGRLKRAFTPLPKPYREISFAGGVVFGLNNDPFLNADDLRAMASRTYDLNLCGLLEKKLRPGDTFVDVGANVGYVSAVAASLVGPRGRVFSFEPLPECFARIEAFVARNPAFRIHAFNMALGQADALLPIVFDPRGNAREATLVAGHSGTATHHVRVGRLDDVLLAEMPEALDTVRVVKIDVEGFEGPVLQGMSRVLSNKSFAPVIVCEVKPWEWNRTGATLDEVGRMLEEAGYRIVRSDNHARSVRFRDLTEFDVVVLER